MSAKNVLSKIDRRRKSILDREMLIAASLGQLDEVKSLIEDGANVNFTDADGNTALHYAVANDKREVVRHLLQLPVDITQGNGEHVTPLDLARERNIQPIVESMEEQVWLNALQTLKHDYPVKTGAIRDSDEQQRTTFMESTLSGVYWKLLQLQDIANVLRFRYFKDDSVMTAATDLKTFRSTLEECKTSRKRCILVADLGNLRWTTIAIYFQKRTGSFHTFVENPSWHNANQTIVEVLIETLEASVEFYEFPSYESIQRNSGVFALKYADMFYSCTETHEKMQEALNLRTIDRVDERIFLANLLNEKQRTEQKIKTCSEIFAKLVGSKSEISKLSFKNMNAFVLFLKAFALEDTHTAVKDPILEKTIRKIKKDYFTHFYFQPKKNEKDEKPNYRLIVDARNCLLHGSRIVTLDDCGKLIAEGKLVENFFEDLNTFINGMHAKITSTDHARSVIKCSSFLSQKGNDIGIEGDLEYFGRFMKDLYQSENEIADEKLEEIMFDLTVNVIPLLDNKKEKFGPLSNIRNKLVHNFQQYNATERLREMKRLTFPLKSNLFKYYYAKRVHDVLIKYSVTENYANLGLKIVDALKSFEEDFSEKTHVTSADDANSFVYMFQNSVFPQKDEEINNVIEQYFEFMIILDADYDDNTNDEGDSSDFSNAGQQLSDLQKREIFEDILKIKSFLTSNNDFAKKLLKDLKVKMKQFGIKEPCISKIVEQITKSERYFDQLTKYRIAQIRANILIMKNFMIDHKIPLQVMITSYKCNNFAPLKEIANEAGATTNHYLLIKFQSLLKENCTVKIHDIEINLSIETITINILKLFHNAYNKYQIKFNNAEDAFRDETFLSYLISRLHPENELLAYSIMKKLLKIKYTVPYLACLLEKFPRISMEKKEITEMVGFVCRNDLYVSHIVKLINAIENNNEFDIFEEIVNIILDKEYECIKILEVTLQHISSIEKMLKEITKRLIKKPTDRIINLTRKVLNSLNFTIKQLMFSSKFLEAEQIIELAIMNEIYSQAIKLKLDEINDFCLYAAKVKNFIAQKKDDECPQLLFQQALAFLDKVTHPNIQQKLLVLSRRSYTKQLLYKFEEALNGFEQLYKEIVQLSLALNELPETGIYSASIYNHVEKSKQYIDLLEKSHENRKYLNIFGVRRQMAFILLQQNKIQDALNVHQELYKAQLGLENHQLGIIKTQQIIAKHHKLLGDAHLKDMLNIKARTYYVDCLLAESKSLNLNKKTRGNIHPMNLVISKSICRTVKSIRKTIVEQALAESDEDTKKNLFSKSDIILDESSLNSLMIFWKRDINRSKHSTIGYNQL